MKKIKKRQPMGNKRTLFQYLILICILVYLINSFILFYETYLNPVGLRAPDKPLLLFIIEWMLSFALFFGINKGVWISVRIWNMVLFVSITIFLLSVMGFFLLFYYSNTRNNLLNFFTAVLSITYLMRKNNLIRTHAHLVWKPIIISLICSFFVIVIIYISII